MHSRLFDRKSITSNPAILAVSVAGLATLSVVLFSFPWSRAITGPVDLFTAQIFSIWSRMLGFDVASEGTALTVKFGGKMRSVIISYGCDGLLAYLILSSAILPLPCAWKLKLKGLFFGGSDLF